MRRPSDPSPRRFFLAAPVDERAPRLLAGEAEHALRVLRLGPGAELLGLDGRGMVLPCRVQSARGRDLVLEPAGAALHEPAPGEPGAPLPWITLAVSWPRSNRAADMLDRLTQLGVAAVVPLRARQAGPPAGLKPERLLRVLREACKQSRRSHLPEWTPEALAPEELPEAFPGASFVLADPAAEFSLDVLARSMCTDGSWRATRARPLVVCVGPEGGFDEAERSALRVAGASSTRLAPHVLRIETAAEAALAVLAATFQGRASGR